MLGRRSAARQQQVHMDPSKSADPRGRTHHGHHLLIPAKGTGEDDFTQIFLKPTAQEAESGHPTCLHAFEIHNPWRHLPDRSSPKLSRIYKFSDSLSRINSMVAIDGPVRCDWQCCGMGQIASPARCATTTYHARFAATLPLLLHIGTKTQLALLHCS